MERSLSSGSMKRKSLTHRAVKRQLSLPVSEVISADSIKEGGKLAAQLKTLLACASLWQTSPESSQLHERFVDEWSL